MTINLTTFPAHTCPYLPDRLSTTRAFFAFDQILSARYHDLMDAGFRRSGRVIYQPACDGCRACVPIRIPVATFTPSKSQRRTWRSNQDIKVTIDKATPTQEKFDLYCRYQSEWHNKPDERVEDFVSFLYDSPVQTLEFSYRDAAGTLLAVGICDESPRQSLSSVYLYHDPDEFRRGLGNFSALYEIEYARQHEIPYWYLGYWVSGCPTMDYKKSFRPHQLLDADGNWR